MENFMVYAIMGSVVKLLLAIIAANRGWSYLGIISWIGWEIFVYLYVINGPSLTALSTLVILGYVHWGWMIFMALVPRKI
jgi:hypothetical protein